MVKNIYGKRSLDMEFSEIKDFAVAPKVDKKGIKGKVNLAIATVRDTLFAKFNQVVHKFVSGEWINDEKIRQTLLKNIEDLKKPKQTSLDNPEAEQKIIKNTIKEIRLICDYLQKKGVPKNRVNTVRDKLNELSSKDLGSRRTTELGVAEEKEEEELNPETEEDKLHEESVTRSKLRRVEEEEEIDLSKVEEEEDGEVTSEEIDLKKLSPGEQRKKIGEAVNRVIDLAYSKEMPQLTRSVGDEEATYSLEDVKLRKPQPLLTVSLGQRKRENSSENKKLKNIQREAQGGFKEQSAKQMKKILNDVINLIDKGFKQKIKTKAFPVIGIASKTDRNFLIDMPERNQLPEDISKALEELKQYRDAL